MQVNSNINKKKKIHKIHLHATSNFNLIFYSQDIIWQLDIKYILSSKRDITLARIVVIETDLDNHKIHLHTTHLTFCSQVIIRKPKIKQIHKGT